LFKKQKLADDGRTDERRRILCHPINCVRTSAKLAKNLLEETHHWY